MADPPRGLGIAAAPTGAVDAWEIVVIETTTSTVTSFESGVGVTATREPIAIVVCHPDGIRAFDLGGREVPIQRS